MLVYKKSENNKYSVLFKGTKLECEKYLLNVLNNNFLCPIFTDINFALKFFKKRGTPEVFFRDSKKLLRFSFNGRYWVICTKKDFYKRTKMEDIITWYL